MYRSEVSAASGGHQGGSAVIGDWYHPIVWSGSSQSWVDLAGQPNVGGVIKGMFGGFQAGNLINHASMWAGTAESRIDLHPAGNYYSLALALDASQQVGYTIPSVAGPQRAALWTGSEASYVNLHPPGRLDSEATACAGGLQGGWYRQNSAFGEHAAIWSGTAQSMIDLNPAGATESSITGMVAGQQVGWSEPITHAILWRGTAASAVDMNPPGFIGSVMNATCGTAQAGWASGGSIGGVRAGVWFGSPQSFVSLLPFTPAGYGQSVATSVSQQGSVFYVGGFARNLSTNQDEAFVWIGVPAPGTVGAFGAAGVVSMRRARR
jgi:hypothetical protein